jgi:transcriptional repressor NrdR
MSSVRLFIVVLSVVDSVKCLYCGSAELKVLETRDSKENRVRRRRECVTCGKRFTTYEYIEKIPLMVRKKDGRLERFQVDKIIRGLQNACEKRCKTLDQIRELAEQVRQDLISQGKEEVSSREIGELVMKYLKEVDRVAYVRFASVYREFGEVNDFDKVIREVKK